MTENKHYFDKQHKDYQQEHQQHHNGVDHYNYNNNYFKAAPHN